jgi:anti-sigma-K factor RskA
MDIEAYISSGILELYVAGLLDEEQNLEVYRLSEEHPKIKEEVLAIEAAILALSKSSADLSSDRKEFAHIINRLGNNSRTKVRQLQRKRSNWFAYTGWAAALALLAGLWWVYNQNKALEDELQLRNNSMQVLEDQIYNARNSLDKTRQLLDNLRDKDIQVVSLGGQKVSPESYAKAYWDKAAQKVFIDARGLPEPPPGMVYQVWSLKLSPLTPTSIGLLEDFMSDENKIFALSNPNATEAFGITLEPAGGSETPTLEQLYTLGAVQS